MKQKSRKYLYLIPLGLLAIALSQVVFRYIDAPDSVKGLCMGAGIGLMLLALIKRYRHSSAR